MSASSPLQPGPQPIVSIEERRIKFPIGAEITAADLEHDPYPVIHRLRAREPVSWLPAFRAWMITPWSLAVEVIRDAETFTVDHPGFSTARVVGSTMLSLDGSAHKRHRSPFDPPFRKREAELRFREPVARHIDQLLNELAPQGRAELRRDYAGPIAVQTMITALDLEQVAIKSVLGWYDTIVDAVTRVSTGEPVSRASKAAFAALRENLLPSLRSDSDSSLLAAISGATSDLSDDEIIANAAVLLFGGIETTEGMIANALFHLLANPAVLETVRRDLGLVPAVVEESLRLEPAASVIDRYAVRDVALGTAQIKAGDLVRVSLLGANRDPDVFPSPDRFDSFRSNLGSHVAFAQGPHVCLGLHLARLEAQEAVQQALAHLPNLALQPTAEAFHQAKPRGLVFRKPRALEVTWA